MQNVATTHTENTATTAKIYFSVTQISSLFGVNCRTVQTLVTDGIISKENKNQYDLISCAQGYIRHLQERASGTRIHSADFGSESVRVKKLTGDKLQLEVALLQGKLVKIEDVENTLADIILSARGKLLALPGRLAKVAIAAESLRDIETNAREIINEALFELSYDKSKSIDGVMDAAP